MKNIFTFAVLAVAVLVLTGCPDGGSSGGTVAAPSVVDPSVPVTAPPPVVVVPAPKTNSAPVLTITDSLNGTEGVEIVLHLIGTDANGDPLTYSCVMGCIAGMVLNSANEFRWTPSFTQAGTYPMRFRVSDGKDFQDYDATVVIANVNRAPVMNAMTSTTILDSQVAQYTPSATDVDGDALIIQLVSALPANATFTAGLLRFQPATGQIGSFTFTFRAFDGAAYSANQSVTVNVSNSNRAPILASIGPKSVNETVALNFSISASDPDGDVLTASATGLPTGATFNVSTGAFAWTPTCLQAGSYSVTFNVTDGFLNASEIVAITVVDQNCGIPAWQGSSSILSTSGNNVSIQITNAIDPDGVAYGYVNESDCNNSNWTNSFNITSRVLALTRQLTGGGQADYGSHAFIVYAQDGFGARSYLQITVTANAGGGGGFMMSEVQLGSTYSMAGFCGAGTIYTHP